MDSLVREHGAIEQVHPDSYEEESLFDFDLRTVLDILRRNVRLIIAVIIAAMVAGLVVTMLLVPKYVATSKVLVEDEAPQIVEGGDLSPAVNSTDADRFLQTQVDMIKSRALAQRVVGMAKLADDPEYYETMGSEMPDISMVDTYQDKEKALAQLRIDTATDLLAENLEIILPDDSRVISINFTATDPAYASKIANAFAASFMESNLNRKYDSSSYARQFLSQQLEEARARLETSERELNLYSRAAGLIRVSGQEAMSTPETTLSTTNSSLVQLNAGVNQATADRITAEDKWKTISGQKTLSVPQILANPAIQAMLQQRSEIESKLADERERHRDAYPTIQALTAQLVDVNSRIETLGSSIKRSVYLDYQAAREREQTLQAEVEQLKSEALDEQDRGVQYNILRRVAETNRALYDSLLERYNSLSAAAGAAANNVALVDTATVPKKPSSPVLLLNLAVAFVLGVILAAIAVFIREHFDDTIKEPADVERKLGLPLLGLIPLVDPDNVRDEAADPTSSMAESHHSLVATLRYSTAHGMPEVLMVTSAGPSEGKSTTSHAIAVDLARLGKSVILVDADLRRPTLHSRIAGSRPHGLTDLLTGQAEIEDVLQPSGIANLSYITALPIPPEPSLLLGSDRLNSVIGQLRTRSDVVVIDSPPVLGLSDATTLATHAEGVLVMVNAAAFRRGAVKSSLKRLQMVHANILGVVLSKFDFRRSSSDYAYYGYDYYNYGTGRDA